MPAPEREFTFLDESENSASESEFTEAEEKEQENDFSGNSTESGS